MWIVQTKKEALVDLVIYYESRTSIIMPAQYRIFPHQVSSAAKPAMPQNTGFSNRPLPPLPTSSNNTTLRPQQRTHTIRRKPVPAPLSALPNPPPSIPPFPPTPDTPITMIRTEGPSASNSVFCKFCNNNIFLGEPCFKHTCSRKFHIPCYNSYHRQLRLSGGGPPKCPGCDFAVDPDLKPWPEVDPDERKPKPAVARRTSTLGRVVSRTMKMLKRAMSSGDGGDRPVRKKEKEVLVPKVKSLEVPPRAHPRDTATRNPLLRGVSAPARLHEKPLPPPPPAPSGKATSSRIPHPPRGRSAPGHPLPLLREKPLPPTPLTAAVLPKGSKETFTFRDGAWVRERPEGEPVPRGDYLELHCW